MNETELDDASIAWILESSQLVRDLVADPDEDATRSMSLVQRLRHLFPDFSLCGADEKDRLLAATVVRQWSVDPLPFWFLDLFRDCCADDEIFAVSADLQTRVDASETAEKAFWSGLLALVRVQGQHPFWNIVHALAVSRMPVFQAYWCYFRHRCPLDARSWTKNVPEHVVDAVLKHHCTHALKMILANLPDWGTAPSPARQLPHWNNVYTVYSTIRKRMFAHDWVKGLELLVQWRESHSGTMVCLMYEPAAHPAVFAWCLAWTAGQRNRYDDFRGVEISSIGIPQWIARSLFAMKETGTLPLIYQYLSATEVLHNAEQAMLAPETERGRLVASELYTAALV